VRIWLCIFFSQAIVFNATSFAEAAGLCDIAPDEYVMEPIRGKVVDEETGAPIEGAIVAAFWKTIQPLQYLKIEESVTNVNGEFFFAGWGPIKRPKPGCFYQEDPLLRIFKPGYYAMGTANTYYLDPDHPGSAYETMVNPFSARVRKARFNAATIKMKKFVLGAEIEFRSPLSGQIEKRHLTEKDWCDNVHFLYVEENEHWSMVPMLLKSLREEKKKHPDCFKPNRLPKEDGQ
jgi:hypothetical protein